MMRFENSPEYEAETAARMKDREVERQKGKQQIARAKTAWRKTKNGWLPINKCPFKGLNNECGYEGRIVVTDGKQVALATIKRRFGRPQIWVSDKPPEYVWRDGMMCIEGEGEWKEPDWPDWLFEWEFTDQDGTMTYAGGHETGREEIDFVPTLWSFLPEPPTQD